ncbi:MAG: Uma2 family endonuclease [Cyanobacteria bacterium J06639_1]
MVASLETKTLTAQEYLEREVLSDTRNEFHAGEIVSMTGGTPRHNRISGNLYILLSLELKKLVYEVFHLDQRLWIPEREFYTYPDVMVTAKPLVFQSGRKDTLENACFIAEVLSKSTRSYDLGDKFTAYRTIETLQEYVLIDQYRVNVEHRVRNSENQWLVSYYDRLDTTFQLKSFDVEIAIADLYENVELDTADASERGEFAPNQGELE